MKKKFLNKINTILITVCLLVILVSCEDMINLEPERQMTIDLALSTLDRIEGSLYGIYDQGRRPYTSFDNSEYRLCHSDLIKTGSHLTDQAPFNQFATLGGFDATNRSVREIWNAYYIGLARANKTLEVVEKVQINEDVQEEVDRKKAVIAVAKYFRAYFHKCLVERWENIVLANQVFDDPADKGSLADPADVYALIVSDLLEAIPDLPDAVAGQNGYISKGVARHLLSLVYMDLGNWSDAATLAVQVINDPAYQLVTNPEIIFETSQYDNPEIIFSWQFDLAENVGHARSVQLTPLYDRVDGVARTFEQGGRPWARLHPSDYYWTLFEDYPNDLRLEAWHKRFWVYDDSTALPPGVSIGDTVTPDNVAGTSGFDIEVLIVPTVTKYWEDETFGRVTSDAGGYRNIIHYRISEAYLIAAEAYMRAGDVLTGQTYFDAVRARADIPSIPLNESNLIDEHARELGLEGHRYAFLKRLGILYERVTQYTTEWPTDVYKEWHTRWPIPQDYVDISKVKQNEGY